MTGLGAMMAGGNPANGRKEDDWYATPIEPTVAALGAVKFDGVLHECACGDGAIGQAAERLGYKVVANDINPRGYGVKRNFFTIERPVGHNILSNPPWNLAEEFIRHGLKLNPRKMLFLLKSTYFHAKCRAALFEEHPPSVIYPLTWRLDFKNKGRPVVECSWYLWERGVKRDPVVRLLHRPTPEAIRDHFAIVNSHAA